MLLVIGRQWKIDRTRYHLQGSSHTSPRCPNTQTWKSSLHMSNAPVCPMLGNRKTAANCTRHLLCSKAMIDSKFMSWSLCQHSFQLPWIRDAQWLCYLFKWNPFVEHVLYIFNQICLWWLHILMSHSLYSTVLTNSRKRGTFFSR